MIKGKFSKIYQPYCVCIYNRVSLIWGKNLTELRRETDKSTIKINFNTPLLVEQVNRISVRIWVTWMALPIVLHDMFRTLVHQKHNTDFSHIGSTGMKHAIIKLLGLWKVNCYWNHSPKRGPRPSHLKKILIIGSESPNITNKMFRKQLKTALENHTLNV